MPKNQIIYNQIGAFVGPAPSTGFHFISGVSGILNNEWDKTTGNYSLIFPFKRVINASYSIESTRTNISHLGDFGTISRPQLEPLNIQLNFDYYLMGLVNELRMGLLANIPINGNPEDVFLYGTGRVSLLSGLYSRDYDRTIDTELNWPPKCREPKNIFFAVKKDNFDLNNTTSGIDLSTLYQNTSVDVYGFGDCFLNSYKCSAGIQQIPTVSVGFLANNIQLYSSGLCCDIPSINTQTYNIYSGIKFSIPNNFEGTGLPTVMIPKDISIDIRQRSNNSTNLDNLLLDYTDIKLQNFDFSFSLNRSPLYSIGYKYPLDKPISAPIISDLTFNLLPGDKKAGSLVALVKQDELYDISIRLGYQFNTAVSNFNNIGICYEFVGAKFNGFNSNVSISERENNSLSFTTELDPTKKDRGLFFSGYFGLLNPATGYMYLGDDFDGFGLETLLTESSDLLTISSAGSKILY